MSEDLITWLRRQVEARKALAVKAAHDTDGHWWRREHAPFAGSDDMEPIGPLYSGEPWLDDDGTVFGGENTVVYDEGCPSEAEFDHIAASDPRDTIDRCEAELAILDEHYILTRDDRNEDYEDFCVVSIGGANKDRGCVTCHYYGQGGVKGYGYCRTVRLLGWGYRHRDGYQEGWGP